MKLRPSPQSTIVGNAVCVYTHHTRAQWSPAGNSLRGWQCEGLWDFSKGQCSLTFTEHQQPGTGVTDRLTNIICSRVFSLAFAKNTCFFHEKTMMSSCALAFANEVLWILSAGLSDPSQTLSNSMQCYEQQLQAIKNWRWEFF